MEKFIERGTDFELRYGKLSIYETNCACRDIQFYFEQFVMTMMLAGHKTIGSDHLQFEFFPGTFFIPEMGVINHVSIPNASLYNPTKCLVLELQPSFIQSVYEDILYSTLDHQILYDNAVDASSPYFISNDHLLIKAFAQLYELEMHDHGVGKEAIKMLTVKEILYRVFATQGLHLLKRNFERSVSDANIRKVISYIRSHLGQKLTVAGLAEVAALGRTTFFRAFKEATGQSPTDYILRERIKRANILIQKRKLSLQEVAFQCGFNSYEYFCSSFKKLEGKTPSEVNRFAENRSLAYE